MVPYPKVNGKNHINGSLFFSFKCGSCLRRQQMDHLICVYRYDRVYYLSRSRWMQDCMRLDVGVVHYNMEAYGENSYVK